MYIAITGSKNNKDVYIYQSFRKEDGKSSSRIYKKLGKFNDLIAQFDGDKDKMLAWAKSEARKETELYNQKNGKVSIDFSQGTRIAPKEQRLFNVGYLFLQSLVTELRLDKICRSIKGRHKYLYDLHAILTDLIYARILHPSSKRESYAYCKTLLEPPKYSLQDVYRALSVLAEESDFIQSELYQNSNFVHPRNKKILYYDCTNFYFEIEQEDELRRYGKARNTVQSDRDHGIVHGCGRDPLAFDIFPGNQNEQTTLKPLEQKIIRDFNCSEFIFCSDSGLGSLNNRRFNSFANRAYVITHSLKKMKEDERRIAMDPTQFRKIGSKKLIDLRALDETDEETYNSVYYKEYPLVTADMDETLIVTYSPKYAAYQRRIRESQIERAQKLFSSAGKKRKSKNPNDPMRFIKTTTVTADGEIAEKQSMPLTRQVEKSDV
ncbi:MAG: transposase [Eisenbergiella sp.]